MHTDMAFARAFLKRGLGDAIGLPTPVALAIFIGVPILVLGSTGILIYYCLKARAAKRKARDSNRSGLKDSHHSIETDHEMGTMSIRSKTYASSTLESHQRSPNNHFQNAGPNEFDRQLFASQQFYGAKAPPLPYQAPPSYGADPDIPTYEKKSTPAPIPIIPQRPKTAPSSPLNGAFSGPVNVNRLNYGNRAPLQELRPSTASDASPSRTLHRRSKSLERPAPIQISSRPTHSPHGSVRSFSVFPHRHVNPNSPGFPPTHQGPSPIPAAYGASPSPPPVSPMSNPRRSPPHGIPPPPPPPPHTARLPNPHVRHPSMDRNSLMPIAPILIPSNTVPSTPTILHEQLRSGSRQGRKRGDSITGNYL